MLVDCNCKNMINFQKNKFKIKENSDFLLNSLFKLSFIVLFLSVLKPLSGQNKISAFLFNEKGKSFFNKNIDSSVFYFKKALFSAQANNTDSLIYKVSVNLGLAYSQKTVYDSALWCFNKALKFVGNKNKAEKSKFYADYASIYIRIDSLHKVNQFILKSIENAENDSVMITKNYLQFALAAYQTGKCNVAVNYYRKCNDFIPINFPAKEKTDILFNTGLCFQTISSYSTALKYFKPALKLSQKINYNNGKISALNNIAQILAETGQMNQALDYFETAREVCRNNNDKQREVGIIANIGKVYLNNKQYQKAIEFLSEACNRFKDLPNGHKAIIRINLNLGEAYYKTNRLKKARTFFSKVLEKSQKSTIETAMALYYSAEINSAEQNFIQAAENYIKSLEIAEKLRHKKLTSGIYFALSKVTELEGNLAEANRFLKQYIKLNNEIYSDKLSTDLAVLQAEYDLYKKQTEIKQLKTDSELQNTKLKILKHRNLSLITGAVFLIIFLMAVTVLFLIRNKAYRELVRKNLKIVEQEDIINSAIKKDNQVSEKEPDDLILRLKRMLETKKLYKQQGLTSSVLAEKLGTNRTYLSQAVNKELNISFSRMINEYRVKEAIRLLSDSKQNLSIEGIAKSVGFSSKSSFNPAFKNYTGVTPSFFRENVLNESANTD